MPNMDGTGPEGQGPMTGRGFGNCAGAGGLARCCGRRFGFRRQVLSKEEKKADG